jgi:hypothetical protein
VADTVLSIGLAQGVVPPNNPPPPVATPFDCVFDRSLGTDESGQLIPAIRDVARGLLDASLVGSVTLPDAVPLRRRGVKGARTRFDSCPRCDV